MKIPVRWTAYWRNPGWNYSMPRCEVGFRWNGKLGVGGDYQNNLLWTERKGRRQLRGAPRQSGIPVLQSACIRTGGLADEDPQKRGDGQEIAVPGKTARRWAWTPC